MSPDVTVISCLTTFSLQLQKGILTKRFDSPESHLSLICYATLLYSCRAIAQIVFGVSSLSPQVLHNLPRPHKVTVPL